MRLTNEVYLVGGGPTLGFGLSPDPDCHVYAIDGGDELALVDAGLGDGDAVERIVATIVAEGLDLAKLRRLLLTHYHADHAGGAAAWRARFGVEVVAPAGAAPVLRGGDERAIALDVAKAAGFYRADYRFAPVAVDREVGEGDRIVVGDLAVEVFDTPGHCDGHVSYLLHGRERRYLLAGDAVFCGGRVVLQNIHDCRVAVSAESVAKLAGREFDALLPGHGPIALSGGRDHVRRADAAFGKLFVPPGLG